MNQESLWAIALDKEDLTEEEAEIVAALFRLSPSDEPAERKSRRALLAKLKARLNARTASGGSR